MDIRSTKSAILTPNPQPTGRCVETVDYAEEHSEEAPRLRKRICVENRALLMFDYGYVACERFRYFESGYSLNKWDLGI